MRRSSSNPFAAYYLVRHVRERLHNDLFYSNEIAVSSIDALKGLKDQLLTGPVEIAINSARSFELLMPIRQYREAICRRHFFGVRRARRLALCASRLLDVSWISAWALVTTYYSAYFSALELLEVIGRHVSHLSAGDAEQVTYRAAASRFRLEAGSYLGNAEVDVNNDEVIIRFRQNTSKPHEFAWAELDQLVRNVQMTDPRGLRHQEAFRRFLGARQSWKKPNEVRNRWNYTDAQLFSEAGERLAEKFMEYMANPEKVMPWALAKHLNIAAEHEASGIAYIQVSLAQAIDGVAEAVLPAELSEQCYDGVHKRDG